MRRRTFILLPAAVCSLVSGVRFSFAQVKSGTPQVRPAAAPQNAGFNPADFNPNNPALNQILEQWELKTGKIQKLSGKHRRYVYDRVFEVETRADGVFYYEAPDKGRIDLEPTKIDPGEVSKRLGKTGKPYSLRPEVAEKWICDGQYVAQGIVQQKVYVKYEIRPEDRGRNIMDSPLPFLFGMPAEKAKERYFIRINQHTNQAQVWLDILPRRKDDRDNWAEAQVILDRRNFLPVAVKLIDVTGNRETVYAFSDLEVNKKTSWIGRIFGTDPFDIDKVFKDYQQLQQDQAARTLLNPGQPGATPMQRPLPQQTARVQPGNRSQPPAARGALKMPDYRGAGFKFLRKTFEEKGFKIEFRHAGPAPSPDKVYKAAGSNPKPGVVLQPGQKVVYYLYDEVEAAGNPAAPK